MSATGTDSIPWRDRSRALRVSGGILMALGILCAGLTALMALARALKPDERLAPALVYAALAGGLFLLGLGSYRGRRWARDLILLGSAFFLATGVLAAPFVIWMVVKVSTAHPHLAEVRGSVGCVIAAVFAMMFLVFISLPLAFLLFYSRRDVRMTVEHLDPVRGWTQAQPLPVLAAVLVYACSAVGSLVALVRPVLPVPGGILTGAPARGFYLTAGVVAGAVAWGLYRGKRKAWLAAVGLTGAWFGISIVSLRSLDFRELQRAMGASEEELEWMSRVDITPWLVALVAISGLVWLGYLVWLRKFFENRRTSALSPP